MLLFEPPRVKRVFLIRHGQSEANIDWKKSRENSDNNIKLTDEGEFQAQEAGRFLNNYIKQNLTKIPATLRDMALDFWDPRPRYPKIRLWHSPYTRTRQTANLIIDNAPLLYDMREHLLLCEQRFGLFDGLSDKERAEKYPDMYANYLKAKASGDKMWPKMPLGDSRFDVCQRVHQAFGTFHRDAQRHGIENIVVVGHGTTNRAFTLMWLHYPYEWMHEEPNPNNCSIRLLENGIDKGYIFDGF